MKPTGCWSEGKCCAVSLSHENRVVNTVNNKYPIAVEKEWFANKNRTIIGAIALDSIDEDWAYVILEKDKEGIFHWIDGDVSLKTREIAREQILKKMEEIG